MNSNNSFVLSLLFFFDVTSATEIYSLSLHETLPINCVCRVCRRKKGVDKARGIFYTLRMIKLIATDLDGTLLSHDKSLPDGFSDVAGELLRRDIVFVAASGRQYDNIYETLAPVSDRCYIISENGAINGYADKVTETRLMSAETIAATLDFADRTPCVHAVCCCAHVGVYYDEDPRFVGEMSRYYLKRRLSGANEARNAPACKIALYCEGNAEHIARIIPKFEGATSVVSGVDWVDVANVGVTKGSALAEILKKTGIRPEECLAFGDQFNDREMLDICGTAFVTANASEGMRGLFPVIGDCGDGAVLGKIKELCL